MKSMICAFLMMFSASIFCQEEVEDNFNIVDHSMHLPYFYKNWKYQHSLGFSLVYLPKDWLESAYSLPMVYYKSNFHLFKGLILNTDIKTVIAASDMAIGPSYNMKLSPKLHLGIGYQFSYGLGMLYDLGYDNTLTVRGHRPYLKLGYQFENLIWTLKTGVDFSEKINFEAGSTNLSGNIESLNGYHISLFLEQRMFRNKSCSMGFTSSFQKFHILAWPAFTYTRRIYYVPEFTALFNF